MVTAALGDQRMVGFVEEEVAGELLRRGVCCKPPVAGRLLIRKELDGHGSLNDEERPDEQPLNWLVIATLFSLVGALSHGLLGISRA